MRQVRRKNRNISNIVKTTNDWIWKYGTTIKKVDIVMNDGVNKMAENTAGYPSACRQFQRASRWVVPRAHCRITCMGE